MARVTGGELRFLKRIQAAQFEPKEAEARISFAVDEGEDDTAILDRVRQLALSQVARMLGVIHAEVATIVMGEIPTQTQPETAETRKRGRPPGSANKPKMDEAKAAEIVENTADPLALPGDPTPETQASTDGGTPSTVSNDPLALDDVNTAAEVVVVTDAILMDKITRKNAALIQAMGENGSEAPKRIKQLIATYAGGPAPLTSRSIPAEKRAAFLLELDALK